MKKIWLIVAIFLFCCITLFATDKIKLEFIDQKYSDIFFALSEYCGYPIIADSTVTGSASFQCSGTDFNSAFATFLRVEKLLETKIDTTSIISKIRLTKDTQTNEYRVETYDCSAKIIFEKISKEFGSLIFFDPLPTTELTLSLSSTSIEEIVKLIMISFSDYTVSKKDNHIHVQKKASNVQTSTTIAQKNTILLSSSHGLYTLEAKNIKFSELLSALCSEEKIGFTNLLKNDPLISQLQCSDTSFSKTLQLILEHASAESFTKDSILYIVASSEQDVITKIKEEQLEWIEFSLKNIRSSYAVSMVSQRFPTIRTLTIANSSLFLALIDKKTHTLLIDYISLIDRAEAKKVISLHYITYADFIKLLPPSISKEDISDTGTGKSFFFSGSNERRQVLEQCLQIIDTPKSRIRYDMLIIQYDRSKHIQWKSSIDLRQLKPGDMTAIVGSFGNLIALNFDVISLFGYHFSAELNAALSENSAQVVADTTLHGISGEQIKFQNTSTYRYKDSTINPETGKAVYSGITREIISGIILDIHGWVSGDGMVTMNIQASVSKRGADTTSSSGNPPPTSEKNISTRLNTSNGVPVVLSGLVQNSNTNAEQRIPFISRIPLIGLLFRGFQKTEEKTEMVIYIVPHITNANDTKIKSSELLKTAIDRLVFEKKGESKI